MLGDDLYCSAENILMYVGTYIFIESDVYRYFVHTDMWYLPSLCSFVHYKTCVRVWLLIRDHVSHRMRACMQNFHVEACIISWWVSQDREYVWIRWTCVKTWKNTHTCLDARTHVNAFLHVWISYMHTYRRRRAVSDYISLLWGASQANDGKVH